MKRALSILLTATAPIAALPAAPAFAQPQVALPVQLGPNARAEYRAIFDDIDTAHWVDAIARLDARLAEARGVAVPAALPEARTLSWLGSSPRRGRTATTDGDAAASAMGLQIVQFIKEDRPTDAEALLIASEATLTPAAVTEWRQRVAWAYYLESDDVNARRLAELARTGAGDWAAQGDWVVGLAAWRQRDWTSASAAFAALARRSTDAEMVAAGHYWAARADMVRGQPDLIQPRLRQAARNEETFYGMLASGAMGIAPRRADDGAGALRQLAGEPNVRAALALAEIGEGDRADTLIRWQARIGPPREHVTLTALAGRMDLPQTQLWLAHNGPAGARATIEGRYPMPGGWAPEGGWRVDRALVFAHALQESRFEAKAVSPAGARGLMQVRPGTASDMAKKKGQAFTGSLATPATNLEYGQSYIEHLRGMAQTGGLLPKVIAAYNAGPAPLETWNLNAAAAKDPLLYIESIPYWETRGYVTIVLRNYWMYQQQSGERTPSRTALVQGIWPRFPGLPGKGSQIER